MYPELPAVETASAPATLLGQRLSPSPSSSPVQHHPSGLQSAQGPGDKHVGWSLGSMRH